MFENESALFIIIEEKSKRNRIFLIENYIYAENFEGLDEFLTTYLLPFRIINNNNMLKYKRETKIVNIYAKSNKNIQRIVDCKILKNLKNIKYFPEKSSKSP